MSSSPLPGKDFSLTNVLAVLPERLVERATIIVRNGHVERVGDAGPTGDRVIDGGGAVAVAGLVGAHIGHTDPVALRRAGVLTALQAVEVAEIDLPEVDPLDLCGPTGISTNGGVEFRPVLRLGLDDPAAWFRAIECVRRCSDDAAPLTVSIADQGRRSDEAAFGDDDPLHWFTIHAIARRLRLATRWPATADDVDRAVEWGASVVEFPTAIDAARRARERGLHIVADVAGPTASTPSVDAEALTELGLCDALGSDDAPALVATVSRFVLRGVADLQTAMRLVTAGPADAYGLGDRGRLTAGRRADITLLRANGDHFTVDATIGPSGQVRRAGDAEARLPTDVQSTA